jgi:hypothetical protein
MISSRRTNEEQGEIPMKQDNPFQPNTPDPLKSETSKGFGASETSKGFGTSETEPLRVKDTRASQSLAGESKEAAKEVAGSAREALARAKDVIVGSQDTQSTQGNGAREVSKAIRSAAGHLKEGAQDIAQDLAQGIGGQARSAIKGATAAAEDAQDTGQKVLQDAAAGAKGLGQVAAEVVEETKEVLEGAKDQAQGLIRHAKDVVVDSAHRAGPSLRRASRATGAFVAGNAVPISLLGFGAGWLLMSGRHKTRTATNGGTAVATTVESQARRSLSSPRVETLVERELDQPREPIGSLAHRANERVHEAAHVVHDRVIDYTHRAVHQAEILRDAAGERTSQLKREALARGEKVKAASARMAVDHPLLLVALSMGAGVGTAMLFPSTKPEDRLMGDTRDRLIGEARETASSVGQIARKTAEDVREHLSR